MFKLGLGKAEEPEIRLPTFVGPFLYEFQKNIYLRFTHYTKAFDCMDHNKLWKALKVMGIQDHLNCLLRNLYAGQKAKLEPCMEKLIGSRLRKE